MSGKNPKTPLDAITGFETPEATVDAWRAYFEGHPEAMAREYAEARDLYQAGDEEGMRAFLSRSVRQRAQRAAEETVI